VRTFNNSWRFGVQMTGLENTSIECGQRVGNLLKEEIAAAPVEGQ
jgi:hypothetical protein